MTRTKTLGAETRDFLIGLLAQADTDPDREARNEATLRELYARFNRDDITAMAELLTEDYAAYDVAAGEHTTGPEPYLARQRTNRRAMPDARTEITALVVRGDTAVAEVVNRGTQTGPFELPNGDALPPSGRSVEGLSCELYQFRDGRIASGRIYYDFLTVARQLGLPL
ncbi:ester cyclase [Solwaraspora sp. WMMD406]|uniref:ester cyclase n=1 Tax=Solwaraspora sp. WMMD406 TaxID=3016095 RepID=UPI0024178AE5|nr:ester cyclase [Solwaraspora sp. WMMD406]MDG4763959.1 ester cyclase [Solwaraspora sp. WMMD406]